MVAIGWWQFVVVSLGVFRIVRIVGWDDITIQARRWVTGLGDEEHKQWAYVIDHALEVGDDPWRGGGDPEPGGHWITFWQQTVQDSTGSDKLPPLVELYMSGPPVSFRRYYLSKLIRCPWCVGIYLSAAAWLAWEAWPHGMVVAMTPFAISAIVGLVAKNLDR